MEEKYGGTCSGESTNVENCSTQNCKYSVEQRYTAVFISQYAECDFNKTSNTLTETFLALFRMA